MSAMPVDQRQALCEAVRIGGGDLADRWVAGMFDLGLIEHVNRNGVLEVAPTEGFVRFFGLDSIGVSVVNGEWSLDAPMVDLMDEEEMGHWFYVTEMDDVDEVNGKWIRFD